MSFGNDVVSYVCNYFEHSTINQSFKRRHVAVIKIMTDGANITDKTANAKNITSYLNITN